MNINKAAVNVLRCNELQVGKCMENVYIKSWKTEKICRTIAHFQPTLQY